MGYEDTNTKHLRNSKFHITSSDTCTTDQKVSGEYYLSILECI